jgi:ferric-dicitrate binding protein FerR (iron transport regulator)
VVVGTHAIGTWSHEGRVAVRARALEAGDTAWVSGRLVFRDTPLRDVIAELSRAYGTAVTLADSTLADRPVTYTAPITKRSLREVLDVVTLIANAHYTSAPRGFVVRVGRPTQTKSLPSVPLHPTQESQYGK